MANEYSSHWFEVFLDTVPEQWTASDIEGVRDRLPLPEFVRVLDICCGPGRHAKRLVEAGYEIVGIDRDAEAIRTARARLPQAEFVELDQQDLRSLQRSFDAAIILWQSFGFFDSIGNDRVLADIASLLRPGGRLVLELFNADYFAARQGRTTTVRDARCRAVTNRMAGTRLTSTIEYVDGTIDEMSWEVFTPDAIAGRAGKAGFRELERCCGWDALHPPDPAEQRFQVTFEK